MSYHDNIVVPPFSFYFKSENDDKAGRKIIKFEYFYNEKDIFNETRSTFQKILRAFYQSNIKQ